VTMWKKNLNNIRDFIIKNSKVVLPIIVIAAVAVTVSAALGAARSRATEDIQPVEETQETEVIETASQMIQMELCSDPAVTELINSYYNACASGDADVLNQTCDKLPEQELLRLLEQAKYIESYPTLEIYTKPGPEEGSSIVYIYYRVRFLNHEEEVPGIAGHYVCQNEEGKLYIRRSEIEDDLNEYIGTLSGQDDVEELKNKVKVEYNELMTQHPEMLEYLSELDSQVSSTVGEALAVENGSEAGEDGSGESAQNGEATTNEGDEGVEEDGVEEPEAPENTVIYASATTTVNVRSSDSEKADKLGKVSGGTQLQVLEQKENGWTKVLYEGKEGFIKAEYLELVLSAQGETVIGTVTATTNVNVRSAASETADRLGVLAGGDTVDLLSRENGWCKIKYSGRVGYVKEDFVE